MIDIKIKRDCCGCSACVQKCPRECILLKEDNEGFLYPEVEKSTCVNCGLCEKVCPFINVGTLRKPMDTYAAKCLDENIRKRSSSGGIFTLLGKKVIESGGVVFGARFNETWEVVHDYTETEEGLDAFCGSKYVQSRVGDAYIQTERFLKQGRMVLFSGTPCQIRGLRLFLRQDYKNLFTVDFICHGVPSPKVWREYLNEAIMMPEHEECEKKSTLVLNPLSAIKSINFRDKYLGWKEYSIVIQGNFTGQADKNTVLLSDMHINNPFMKVFLSDLILRPSCYDCKTKGGRSGSDITIADFWGIQNIMPEFDDDKGVSAVMINNYQGEEFIKAIKEYIECYNILYTDVLKYNPAFEKSSIEPKSRLDFFNSRSTIKEKAKKYCKKNLIQRILASTLKVRQIFK